MSQSVNDAWDALPPQEEVGDFTYDRTPEAAALRLLFGTSAFRLIDNVSDGELAGAIKLQEKIAKAYLYALEVHRSKATKP